MGVEAVCIHLKFQRKKDSLVVLILFDEYCNFEVNLDMES